VAAERAAFEQWKANQKIEQGYLNLLRNAHMTKTDSSGAFVDLPCAFYPAVKSFQVVNTATAGLPQKVVDQLSGGLIMGRGNIIKVTFNSFTGGRGDGSYWLPGNSITGTFSGGWKWVYVDRGRLRGITAGNTGNILDLTQRSWHADFMFGEVESDTVVYLQTPFVVAGFVTSVDQVQTLNYQSSVFNLANAG
jgi:hypothetical protein